MRLADFRDKLRRFVGAVMVMFGAFALLTGTLAWRRGPAMATMGTLYCLGGAALTYSGIQYFRARTP